MPDRTALVTGASSGIGRAIAIKLAQLGAAVVVPWARSADGSSADADATVTEIGGQGGSAIAIEADIADVSAIRKLYAQALEWRGCLDIVVNCAGVRHLAPIAKISEEDFERVFAINTRGVFFSLQEAARCVTDGGRIINITSGSTNSGRPGNGLYGGSKSAVQYFSRALAWELADRGITVNSVSPGITDTPMMDDKILAYGAAKSPFKRAGVPKDIADVVSLLVSDEAHWITGQNIMATGGADVR